MKREKWDGKILIQDGMTTSAEAIHKVSLRMSLRLFLESELSVHK